MSSAICSLLNLWPCSRRPRCVHRPPLDVPGRSPVIRPEPSRPLDAGGGGEAPASDRDGFALESPLPSRNGEALALDAARALRLGRPELAFRFADRRCRLPRPTAQDFTLRAAASCLMGETAYAEADLRRAFEIDPTHDLVVSSVLAWGPGDLRPLAAESFLEGDASDEDNLRLALHAFDLAGTPIVARLRVRRDMYEGWVAWLSGGALQLIITRDGVEETFDLEPDASHALASQAWSAAQIAIEIESPRLERVSFGRKGERLLRLVPALDRSDDQGCDQSWNRFRDRSASPLRRPMRGPLARRGPAADQVEVVVPVYGDFDATRACLEALEDEGSRIPTHVTLIDDCSPDPGSGRWRTPTRPEASPRS